MTNSPSDESIEQLLAKAGINLSGPNDGTAPNQATAAPNPAGQMPAGAPMMGVPNADPSAQWLNSTIGLRPELRFDVRNRDSNVDVVIEDPIRSKFFQIGKLEYQFLASLNGKLTVSQVAAQMNAKHPGLITEEKAIAICQWLVNSNLVVGKDGDSSRRLDRQAKALSRQQMMGLLNPICFKLRLFNPNGALEAIQPYTQWFFGRAFFAVWAIIALYALSIVCTKWEAIGESYVGILSGGRWLWLLIVWTLLKVVHEIGHGIACRKYGGEVPDAGVLLLLFTPMAFVNVTSSWRFPSRWHRIVVAGAGMYIELFISFIAIIIWANVSQGILADVCFNIFVMASFTTILFNANPLMRFDGYYMLSDAVGVPNLYTKGTKWFGDRVKHLTLGTSLTTNICLPNEKRKVALYGSMAFFWKILISLSLIIGSSVIFHGAGILLAVFGVGLWFGMPIFNQYKICFGPNATQPANLRKTCVSAAFLSIVVFSMFSVMKGPATKSAPAIVQFKDEIPVRADADGFVERIFIANGQPVKKGDVLIELSNPALKTDVENLRAEAKESEIQTRIYRQQGETALCQAEIETHQSLLFELEEKELQAKHLAITAPFDGFVFQRNLENRLGSFVHRGDQLLSIAQRETKEIVVSIDQSDIESIKENEGKELRVVFPGVRVFQSKLTRVNPKASTTPSHPSLCAHVGGPLPVKPTSSDDENEEANVEMLAPRFTAELDLQAQFANQLHSGQRGRAVFYASRQSLGSYLYLGVSDWFRKKLEQATYTAAF